MRSLAAFLFLVCVTGCAGLLTPDERAELREKAAAERQAVTEALRRGDITEAEAADRFLVIDGAEFGVDLDERGVDGELVDELLGLGIGVGLTLLGVPAFGYTRRRMAEARTSRERSIAAKVKTALADSDVPKKGAE